MKSIQQTASVTSLFYRGVPAITGDGNNDRIPSAIRDFAEMCTEVTYVLDFLKRYFHYVVNREFFFCGHSVEEVMSLGYDFYPKIIHRNDIDLLADMHAAILKRACTMDNPEKINYFSFTVRIKTETGYLMAYHKLKPVFIDGQVRFGLCLMSNSVMDTPGNLRAYYVNSTEYEEYVNDGEWTKGKMEALTLLEKKVLIYARQGKNNKMTADEIAVDSQTVRNIKSSIYRKFQVSSITQAIMFAVNHHLIYRETKRRSVPKRKKAPAGRKWRRQMTPDKLLLAQRELNRGKNNIEIAEMAEVSEFTVRYAIKMGK